MTAIGESADESAEVAEVAQVAVAGPLALRKDSESGEKTGSDARSRHAWMASRSYTTLIEGLGAL